MKTIIQNSTKSLVLLLILLLSTSQVLSAPPSGNGGGKNKAPTVSINSPTEGATYDELSSIEITAVAIDTDGQITTVVFQANGVEIGSGTQLDTETWSITWNSVPAGNYAITALATDSGGKSATSAEINISVITVDINLAPAVTIQSPGSGSTYTVPSTVTIIADATDSDGIIERVEFFNGATLIGEKTEAPFQIDWYMASPGTYSLTARATDNMGATATSDAIEVLGGESNRLPMVALTSPNICSTFLTTDSITFNAAALDIDGGITKVEFYIDSSLVGTDSSEPYSYQWNAVDPGTYTLTAKAFDNTDSEVESTPITFTALLPNVPPNVNITSPTENTTIPNGSSLDLTVDVSDSDGTIDRVIYLSTKLNTNTTGQIAIVDAAPYSATWSNMTAGDYAIRAEAFDDDGSATISDPVPVLVTPNILPSVSLASPSSGATYNVPASIDLTAVASDEDGSIHQVELYVGATLIETLSVPPYNAAWQTSISGDYTFTAKATDNSGSTVTSESVTVAVLPNQLPSVNLTSPANGESFYSPATISVSANAVDTDGTITQVEFYADQTLLGVDTTEPYDLTWADVSTGDYSLSAKVTDNLGGTSFSDAVSISVVDIPLQLTFDSPLAGATVTDSVVLVKGTFTAPDNSGILVNDIAASINSNQFYAHVPVSVGENTITAVLTSMDGNSVSKDIVVSSIVPLSDITIDAEPIEGLTPLTVTVTISNSGDTDALVQWNGSGDYQVASGDTLTLNTTLSTSGSYPTTITAVEGDGTETKRDFIFTAYDKAALDQKLRVLWSGVGNALIAGNKDAALQYFGVKAQEKYGPIIDVLLADLPEIFSSFSSLQGSNLTAEYGEYAVNRVIDGENRLFFIYFVKDGNGIWRIESM